MKCKRAVKGVMKQKNLTSEKAVSKEIWRKRPKTRCKCGKRLKIDRQWNRLSRLDSLYGLDKQVERQIKYVVR